MSQNVRGPKFRVSTTAAEEFVPCQRGCPVYTDAGRYVQLVSEGRHLEGYLVARNSNPLVEICGQVCAAPCEDFCRRGKIDTSVTIRGLKNFLNRKFSSELYGAEPFLREMAGVREALDANIRESHLSHLPKGAKSGKRVAVVGAGPAGLACAHDLLLLGHDVTVLEASAHSGGALKISIPMYRLGREYIDRLAESVVTMGGEIRSTRPSVETGGGRPTGGVVQDERNLFSVAAVRVNAGHSWLLAKGYSRSEIQAALAGHRWILFLFALPLLLLAAVLAVVAAGRFSGPIRQLSRVAEAVAQGAYERRSRVTSRDELGDLSVAINEMAQSLAESRAKLLEWNRNLRQEVDRKVEELRCTEEEARRFREEMQELERQLVQAERMASVGMLSATIAHEIGNPIAGLKIRLQMHERRAAVGGGTCEDAPRLLPLVERLEAFLRQLSGYVRSPKFLSSKPADLRQTLQEVAFILREEADRRHVSFRLEVPDTPLTVTSVGQHLHQIFMNVTLNALQAVADGGSVSVEAGHVDGEVVVRVCDDGPGIPEGLGARIFDPLITTKPYGTGLGLPIVKRLLDEIGGSVTVKNGAGSGARAEVHIPVRSGPCPEES